MKSLKKWLALLLTIALAGGLCACGSKEGSSASGADTGTSVNETANATAVEAEPTATPYNGSVYYINADADADAAWQKLAGEYTAETGVPVTIETVTENYNDTLNTRMDSDKVPTAFAVDKNNFKLWQESCYDLTGTELYSKLLSDDMAIKDESGAVKAAGYTYDACGILANTALLQQAGYDVSQINDFNSFSNMVEDITDNAASLGFGAMAAMELSEDTWHYTEFLLNVPLFYEFREDGVTETPPTIRGTYLEEFRYMYDLYIGNVVTAVTRWHMDTLNSAETQRIFGEQEAALAVVASWEVDDYTTAHGLSKSDVTMMPFYCGYEGEENAVGISCGNIEYWCVNREADDLDIQATLDFLAWVVSSSEGTAMLLDTYEISPYADVPDGENPCLNAANAYMKQGRYNLAWVWDLYPNQEQLEADVLHYMVNYTCGQNAGENQWYDITECLRNNWQTYYEQENTY